MAEKEKQAAAKQAATASESDRYQYQIASATQAGLEKLMTWVNEHAATHRLLSIVRLESAICAVLELQKWKPNTVAGSFFDENDL